MEIIKKLRQRNKMTQKELAIELSVADSTISKWESGRQEPGIRELGALSRLFNVSVDELVKGSSSEENGNKQKNELKLRKGVVLFSGSGEYSGFRAHVRHIKSSFVFETGEKAYHWPVLLLTTTLSILFLYFLTRSWFIPQLMENGIGIDTDPKYEIPIFSYVGTVLLASFFLILIIITSASYGKKGITTRKIPNGKVQIYKTKVAVSEAGGSKSPIDYKWSSVVSVHQRKDLINKQRTAVSGWGLLLTEGGINKVNEVHQKKSEIKLTFDDGKTFQFKNRDQEVLSLLNTLSRKN